MTLSLYVFEISKEVFTFVSRWVGRKAEDVWGVVRHN